MSKKKQIPDFATEGEEAEFWDTHAIERFEEDLEDAPIPTVALDARTQAVSLRLPIGTLSKLKAFAAEQGIGYQTLVKAWIEERLAREQEPDTVQVKRFVNKAQRALEEMLQSLEEIKKRA